jgi:DNA-binding NarL/FixJ family response regulator
LAWAAQADGAWYPPKKAGFHSHSAKITLKWDDISELAGRIEKLVEKSGMNMSASSGPIRLLTVDDHPLLRDGIAAMIANQPDMLLVAEAATGAEGIEKFRMFRPDVTLMDLRLPDMSGTDSIQAIREEFPAARIIVLTTYSGDVQAGRALKAGAYGYLLKSMVRQDLVETIRAVHQGHRRVPAEIATNMAEHAIDDLLTKREIEVLKEVASGNSNKIVASNLSITEDTVKAHMKNVLSKLAANDRTHAVMIAMKRGFLDSC